MSQTSDMISVVCSCGKKLKAPATAVGKKAKCPKCNNVITVTAPPPPEDDGLDALYDLAAESDKHAAVAEVAPRCPGCQQPMQAGAVLCTNCGFDTRKGKSIVAKAPAATGTRYDPAKAAAAEAAAKMNKGKGVDKMAPQASYFKGLGGCIGGAAVGATVWCLIAYFTGYEIYFVVLLVAALAGLGMAWGQQGYSHAGGFTAAGVTLIMMIVARIAVVLALVLPMMKHDIAKKAADKEAMRMPDLSMYDQRVVETLFMQELKNTKPVAATPKQSSSEDDEADVEDTGDVREIAAYQAVEKKLKAMPKADYTAMIAKLDREERDSRLEHYMTEKVMGELRVSYRDGSVVVQKAEDEAKKQLAKMSEAEKDAEFAKLKASEAKEREKWAAEMKALAKKRHDNGEDVGAGTVAAITGIVIFFMVFGGLKGAFWTICALALAYRTASGTVSD